MTPQLVMLAGPNGAGKSTYYDAFLAASDLPFLNADLLAVETGADSFEAARLLDAARARMVEDQSGFITETVFSDPKGEKLGLLRRAIEIGFDVNLIFIGLSSQALSERRIDQGVARGGHDVPRAKIAGRFERSLANLVAAIRFVPTVKVYDNSSATEPYRLVGVFEKGELVRRGPGRTPRWAKPLVSAA